MMKLSTMKSYHFRLGILLFIVLVRAQNRFNNYGVYGEEENARDREELEEIGEEYEEDIEGDGSIGGEKTLKVELLQLHNEFRRNVSKGMVYDQPGTNGLHDLVWDENLAKMAKNSSKMCSVGGMSGYKIVGIGQNIASGRTVEEGFKSWTDESVNYNYQSNYCRGECRNYKQFLPIATLVHVAIDEGSSTYQLESVKVTCLEHSMESNMAWRFLARYVFDPAIQLKL
nr:venom allergen (val) protein [Hymenolepis microstoma]